MGRLLGFLIWISVTYKGFGDKYVRSKNFEASGGEKHEKVARDFVVLS